MLGTILESLSVHIVSDIVWNIVFFWFWDLKPFFVFSLDGHDPSGHCEPSPSACDLMDCLECPLARRAGTVNLPIRV